MNLKENEKARKPQGKAEKIANKQIQNTTDETGL